MCNAHVLALFGRDKCALSLVGKKCYSVAFALKAKDALALVGKNNLQLLFL